MMTAFFLFGGIFLAFIFGRNNFSNVFGSAVGTGVLSLKMAAFLTGAFLLLGSYFNSLGTSETLFELSHFDTFYQAFSFSVIVALVMMLLTYFGIPASVAQIAVGALVGWNLGLNTNVDWIKILTILWGWFYSPLIACFLSFFLFKIMRVVLQKYPVPILYRDIWIKVVWLFVGSFTAYSLGANNMPVLITPFVKIEPVLSPTLIFLFSFVAGSGCLFASRKVIKMVTSKLFPLSSLESLIVGFSSALTLLLFSFQNSLLPALPISISAAMIGSIVGVSFGKGGYGLKGKTLFFVIFSWIWAPLFSGLLSYLFVLIMKIRGI